MPTQKFLSSASWVICVILPLNVFLTSADEQASLGKFHHHGHTDPTEQYLNDALSNSRFSDVDRELIQYWFDWYLRNFRSQLRDSIAPQNAHSSRSKRAVASLPSVDALNRLSDSRLQLNAGQLPTPADINCFHWNAERFCIVGNRIFAFRNGSIVPFPSVLPVQSGDYVKAHVHDDVVFLATFNKESATLRLHLLRGPDWIGNSIGFQVIRGKRLEDCVFFEEEGKLFMALAIQRGKNEFTNDVGMQCVIYKWLGTTMDMIQEIPFPELRKVVALQSDSVHLVLIHGTSSVQLWSFTETDKAQLLDAIDVHLPAIHQVDAFVVVSRWQLLFSGANKTLIFSLEDQMLLRSQVIHHRHTTSLSSWTRIQADEYHLGFDAVILIFNAFDPASSFDFYTSDSAGHFALDFSSPVNASGTPSSAIAFFNDLQSAQLYVATFSGENQLEFESFSIQLSEKLQEVDPLLKCLSDVEELVDDLNASKVKQAEELKKNLVHVKDNFLFDGVMSVERVAFDKPTAFDNIKVLYDHTENAKRPERVAEDVGHLNTLAEQLSDDLPQLFNANDPLLTGSLNLTGEVTVDQAFVSSASIDVLNGRNWNEFVGQSWHYSGHQTIHHDMAIESILADDLRVTGAIGVTDPSRWLLRTGGVLSGYTTFANLTVLGNLDVGEHLINGVAMADVLDNTASQWVLEGSKRFHKARVYSNVTADTVNERGFAKWAQSLLLQRNPDEQRVTGTVHLVGTVRVDEGFACDSINGFNVTHLSEELVNKQTANTITGFVRFTNPLFVLDAGVNTLNGVSVEDLLSTSGHQTIRATLNMETVDILGNVQCHDINGIDFDDFLYTDESQSVKGPVDFERNVTVGHLVMERGTLNELDVAGLLDPPRLRIDSAVQVGGTLTADSVDVQVINQLDLTALRDVYWTKSTDQVIDVAVRMPFQVTIHGNITAGTFIGRKLDRSNFYLTADDEVIDTDVVFLNDVEVLGDIEIKKLTSISGVSLKALDEDVVKKDGDFTVFGTKTFEQLTIHGNLKVDETFNGLIIPDDIALLDKAQNLTDFDFDGDVTIDGDVLFTKGDVILNTLADFLFDDFVNQAALSDEPAHIEGNIDFLGHVEVGEMSVSDRLNEVDMGGVIRNGVRTLKQESVELTHLEVHGHLTLQNSLRAQEVNGYNAEEFLGKVVNMTDPKKITGVKRVPSVYVAGNLSLESFNGSDLDLAAVLTVSGNQTITGDYIFENLSAGAIDLTAINGRLLSDYIRTSGTNETQIVTGPLTMEQVTIKGPLSVENRLVNGCNLTQFSAITEFTHFDSLSIADGNSLTMEQPWENNADLATLVFETLKKDRPGSVPGNVFIHSKAFINHLNITNNRLGDVDLSQLLHGSMLKSVEQNVTNVVEYSNEIVISDLNKVGHLEVSEWNGHNVREVVENVVLKNENRTIDAPKTILGDFKVEGNLQVSGSIDGVPSAALVDVNSTRLPIGTQFHSLTIEKELNVTSGLIDGVNLTSVLAKRVPLKGSCIVRSNITFQDSITADNLVLSGVNGLDMGDVVWKTAAPAQAITGKKYIKGNLNVEGNLMVSKLNGRSPEEQTAFMVLKGQDALFDKSVSFGAGLSVMESVHIGSYHGENLTSLMTTKANQSQSSVALESIRASHPRARALLAELERSPTPFADFEFLEKIQVVTSIFPHGSNGTMHAHYCPIPTRMMSDSRETAAGLFMVTHSTDGNNCGLKKQCRCHRSVSYPVDGRGFLNTLPMPTRLKEYLEEREVYGDRVRVIRKNDDLFVIAIETLAGCATERVTIAVLNSITYRKAAELSFELNDTVVDMSLQRNADGMTFIVLGQTVSGLLIYTFDGQQFNFSEAIPTQRVAAVDVIASSETNTLLMAVASYGIEAFSSVWSLNGDGKFELLKDIVTIGATDVAFTASDGDLYLTFAQDPSSIDPYTDNWSQFKVPAQVLFYVRAAKNFELFQQLDIDRVVSLANMEIGGTAFMAAATYNGRVRVYRLVRGQGFLAEQTFKFPGVKSVTGYSLRNETYLSAVAETRAAVFVVRLRGPHKPKM